MPRKRTFPKPLVGRLVLGLALVAGGAGAAQAAMPLSAAPPLALRGSYARPEALTPAPRPPLTPVAPGDVLYEPFFALDWSVGLEGGAVTDEAGTRFALLLTPELALAHTDGRADVGFTTSAEIERRDNRIQVNELRGAFATTYHYDRLVDLGATADISVSRQQPGSPGVAASVTQAPLTIAGTAGLSATRHFGRLAATVHLDAERDIYGETKFSDGTVQSNDDQSRWVYGGGLRLEHPLTPILSGFIDASAARESYDAADPGLGVKLDGEDYSVRAGLTGKWTSVLEAEASLGYGARTFDAAGLPTVTAALYDASLTFHPNPTWTLGAAFSTAVEPPGPNGSGTAEVLYTATASARYAVNQYLALRGSVSAYRGTFAGTADFERGYAFGVGADYALSRHVSLTADYSFQHDEESSNAPSNTRSVLVGIKVAR